MDLIGLISEFVSVVRDFQHAYKETAAGTRGRHISYAVFISRFILILIASIRPELTNVLSPLSQILGLAARNII